MIHRRKGQSTMENHANARSPNKFWIGSCVLFVFWYLLLYGFDWSSLPALSSLSRDAIIAPHVLDNNQSITDAAVDRPEKGKSADEEIKEPCSGRYIYVHDIPRRFNSDYIKQCKLLNKWHDMCQYFANGGLGQLLRDGWFVTHQFSLEVLFHSRMKHYQCLTNDSSKAAAIFVPYYPGLDVSRYLWDDANASRKDSDSLDLFRFLRTRPEWRVMGGKDHFIVSGRITWDFRRVGHNVSDWGSTVMVLPESQNMTMITIESSPWDKNDFAIPYPTYFHPSHEAQVYEWQDRMRKQRRKSLFCFTGAPRPNMEESIRDQIIAQCAAAKKKCRMMECRDDNKHNCLKPANVMKMLQNSVFCLQPPGDSFTRRSTFDSILAGCIPVFFTPASAYVQYLWHLPKDHASYSVLIPESEVKGGRVSIDSVLSQIPAARVAAMRENVIKIIPNVIYAGSRLEKLDDAFELAIKGVIERVESLRKGRNESDEFDSEFSWKYYTFGSREPHEWDSYFVRH